jgi:N-acetylneuraminic acid mutarotase
MSVQRYDHTATLLPSGKVLVAGGETDLSGCCAAPTSSAELYDPSTGTWSMTGAMSTPRENHTATLLFNGKVLVTGGTGDNPNPTTLLTTAEIYDPARGGWTKADSMNSGRTLHTATLLLDGKVLVAGGYSTASNSYGYLASAELYDPVNGGWTNTGTMNNTRGHHTAMLLFNGKVLVAAGYGAVNEASYDTELYDPASGTWATTGTLNMLQWGIRTATLLSNGKVVLAKGYDTSVPGYLPVGELYNLETGTWTETARMTVGGGYHSSLLLPDGKVLVAGGYGPGGVYYSSADIYDPVAGTWTATGSMTTPRKNHSATLLANGQVLITGGYQGNQIVLTDAELYSSTSVPLTAIVLSNSTRLASGGFKFGFANSHGALFSVLATTNASMPLNNWSSVGSVIEIFPFQFLFTDSEATNSQRFYRVRSL